MQIIICLDYSSITEPFLSAVKDFIVSFKEPQISVVHIIDETLFYPATGFETQLGTQLNEESQKLKELSTQYLGPVNYIEAFGIPRVKIDEILAEINYDLLIIGKRSRSTLGERLLGGIAEHLLRNAGKPLLIIP